MCTISKDSFFGRGFDSRRLHEVIYMKNSIKRFFRGLVISWIKNYRKGELTLKSSFEKRAAQICRKVIRHKTSELTMCPTTQARYIKNEELQMYVILKETEVSIVNHQYYYNISISFKTKNNLFQVFDNTISEKRFEMERDILNNTENSLLNILRTI